MKQFRMLGRLLLLCLFCSFSMTAFSQGVIVYKTDGTKVKFPYEQVDSIVTYNYDEDPGSGDGNDTPGVNRTFIVNGVSFTMVAVEGGTFQMGATNEQTGAISNESPVHSVTLSDYSIGETEVTQELWLAVMGSNPSSFTGNLQCPVECVSWNDCQTFITRLNELTGENFKLPTEAQWEYAARGGNKASGYLYSGSNTIGDVAWYASNSGSKTHVVKSKSPNELGLYDISGNVWEWCSDWYGTYSSSAATDPQGPSTGSYRVLRGGGWDKSAVNCRVAIRGYITPIYTHGSSGLRLAL